MSYVLTLVASDTAAHPLGDKHLRETMRIIDFYNVRPTCQPVWLGQAKAADLGISEWPNSAAQSHLREMLAPDRIDLFITAVDGRRKKMLIADMDATIVAGETLDDLAEHAGLKDKIAGITQLAMNGELDFQDALRRRVDMLKGLPVSALHETLEKITFNPGAHALLRTMNHHGAFCVLVSGGFTFFTEQVARKIGFHKNHGNILKIENDMLTGKVREPILDKYAKVDFLRIHAAELGIKPASVLAIGDGANDIPMLKAAGLGIGYRPKEAVRLEIDNQILHGDLSAALYAQGYTQQHILKDE
jgi:phosphoserine phosphatase